MTGDDINEGALGPVPQADFATRSQTIFVAAVKVDGSLLGSQSCRVSSSTLLSTGHYRVTFSQSIEYCAFTATLAAAKGADYPNFAANTIWAYYDTSTANSVMVAVAAHDGQGHFPPEDSAFSLIVVC